MALFVFVGVLYGSHLGDGYLSDDFLYVQWATEGVGELLRHVTLDSTVRMVRPLPALAWLLGHFEQGPVLHHALTLLLHAFSAFLVARIAWHRGAESRVALGAGALFASFPLLTEPVLWLSATPDLLATGLALAAVERTLAADRISAPAAGLFLMALLSKEAVLTLPLVALLALPWRLAKGSFVVWSGLVGTLMGVRWALFGGLGGYAGPGGSTLALALDPWLFLRNLCLQLPFRVLVPFKASHPVNEGPLGLWIAAWTVLCGVGLAVGLRRPQHLVRAGAALTLALLPAASIFSIDVDHENARLLYFPVAVFWALAGPAWHLEDRPLWARRAMALAAAGLLGLWTVAVWQNGRPWSEASREVTQTLDALRRTETTFPKGAVVFVAGHDTWRGAYVWRTGFRAAIDRAGLRQDVGWRHGTMALGTVALARHPEHLGERLFEVGLHDGQWVDWTACQRALHALVDTAGMDAGTDTTGTAITGTAITGTTLGDAASVQLPWIDIPYDTPATGPPGAVAIRGAGTIQGRLWWRSAGQRFRVTHSRAFVVQGDGPSIVRLPPDLETLGGLRLQAQDPRQLGQLEGLWALPRPSECDR